MRLISLLLFLLISSSVKADSHKPLTSAAEPDYPPFSIKGENGKATGFSVELLTAAAKAMELEINYKVAPWSEIKQELANDKLDVLPLVGRTPERESVFDFTTPYLTLHGTIVVQKGNNTIQTRNDLKGKIIGVLKGDVAEEYLIREKLNDHIMTSQSYETALQQLNSGKIDAVVIQKLVALQLINKLKLNNLETRGKLNNLRSDWSFAVTEGDKELLATLNEGLSIIIADGTYTKLRQKWLGLLEPDNTLTYFYIILVTTLIVMFIGFYVAHIWQRSLKVRIIKSTAELEYYKNDLEKLVAKRTHELEIEKYKLAQAQEITHVGSYRWEIESNKTVWSDELFRITGFTPQEFEPNYEKHLFCIHPDDKEIFHNLTKDIVKNKSSYSGEYRIIRPDGVIRHVAEKGEVTLDSENNVLALIGVIQDISERKITEAERVRMQHELLQSQKMESLGQLTGGIAHDFNNLLGIINGYTELAQAICAKHTESKIADYLINISDAGKRATALVAQMLSFSRMDKSEDIPIQFAQLIKDEIKLLRSTLPSTIEIKDNINFDLPKVLMNPTQLHQIIMNLSINARDAMNGVGELTIGLDWVRDLDTQSTVSHKPIHGDWIELSIKDTGFGMDVVTASNIFNPFFTTKEVGKGTGMGLSVVYRIMENHNGHILLETESGGGSVFRLLFSPASEKKMNDSFSTEDSIEIPEGNGEEILVVDDEPLLSAQLSELVTLHGYKATAINDSTEALKLFQQDPQRFSMLITDQTMPKMTGAELIFKIREIQPQFPVIICSGYSDKIDSNSAAELNISYIDKPVDIKKLLLKISKLCALNTSHTKKQT